MTDFVLTARDFSSVEQLRSALPDPFDVNQVYASESYPWRCHPLEWAVRHLDLGVLEFLLAAGARVDSTPPDSAETPLHTTLNFRLAGSGTSARCQAARILIAAGASLDANATTMVGNQARNTPFLFACQGAGAEVRELLAEMLLRIDITAQSPSAIVWHAITNEHEHVLAWCLQTGMSATEKRVYNGKATSLLRYAASQAHQNVAIVEQLLATGPVRAASKRAALKVALAYRHTKIAQLLT